MCLGRIILEAEKMQTAKEILADVFGARPGEVEEMIKGQAKCILALFLLILDGLQQSYSGLTTGATPDFIKNGLQIYLPWRPQ